MAGISDVINNEFPEYVIGFIYESQGFTAYCFNDSFNGDAESIFIAAVKGGLEGTGGVSGVYFNKITTATTSE